jgi:hypothetical protein
MRSLSPALKQAMFGQGETKTWERVLAAPWVYLATFPNTAIHLLRRHLEAFDGYQAHAEHEQRIEHALQCGLILEIALQPGDDRLPWLPLLSDLKTAQTFEPRGIKRPFHDDPIISRL